MRRDRLVTGFSALCAAAVLATPAVAATPAQRSTNPPAHPIVTVILHAVPQTPTPKVLGARKTVSRAPLARQATRSTLPFTGQGLGLFALAGALLIGSGLVLRATARRRPTQ